MATTRTERTRAIELLEKQFCGANGIYLTNIKGVTVSQVTRLRTDFRKKGIKYIVVKNSLARKAVERCGKTALAPLFKGQVGVAFVKDDVTAPSKIIRDFKKDFKDKPHLLTVMCSYVDGTLFNPDDTMKLADVPSREILLAQLLGCLKAPAQNLAGALAGIISKLPATLESLKNKKEASA